MFIGFEWGPTYNDAFALYSDKTGEGNAANRVWELYSDGSYGDFTTSTPNWGFYAAQNGGRARSRGLELELSGGFAYPWRWALNYTYVDAKLVDPVLRADDPNVIVAEAGTRLPGSARHTLSGSLEHTTELSNGWSWVNRLSAYYQGKTENSISASAKFKRTWPSFGQTTVKQLIANVNDESLALLAVNLENPTGYGRIIRDGSGQVTKIVEEKDASANEKLIKEGNTGIMAVQGDK